MVEKGRNLIVFSRTPLFGEGLGKLLSNHPGVKIIGYASTLSEVRSLADQIHPDVIVVDQNDGSELDGETLSDLLDISNEQVLSFTLADRDMIIYTQRRVPASIQELLNALSGVHEE